MWQLNDVNVFVAIVEAGSFIGASKKLAMPSSTVSRRLSELETQLDVKLLERNARKLIVTKEGLALYRQASESFFALKNQIEFITDSQQEVSGLLTVTCPVYLGQTDVGVWLREFSKQYPEVSLNIIASGAYEDFGERQIDLAIRFGPLTDSNFFAKYLFSTENKWVASPDYLAGVDNPLTPESLNLYPLLLMSQTKKNIRYLDSVDQEQMTVFNPKVESNDLSLLKQFTLEGHGIGFLPHVAVRDSLLSGKLIPLLTEYTFLPRRELYMVYPNKRYLSRRAQLLIEFIKEKSSAL